jgi:tripartite-type tricarboxylate transporter receptor subunit TctC
MIVIQRRLALAATLALVSTASAAADNPGYPSKAITLVVPYPAGAAVDRLGRNLAKVLSSRLGQTIVVENVAGASGTLGAKRVLRAEPDGYTLMVCTVNDLVVAPTAMSAGYTVKDFTPVAKMTLNTTALVAHPSLPATDIKGLADHVRQSGGPLLSGATGVAMMQTVGGTMLAEAAGFPIQHVVYKGGAPLMNDLVGGQVKVGTVALASALPLIRQGRLKALGIISLQRDPTAPDIPTVNEAGVVQAVTADLWTGLVGPAGMPASVVSRLSAAMTEVLNDETYRASEFKTGSVVVKPASPDDFGRFLQAEANRVAPLLAKLKKD